MTTPATRHIRALEQLLDDDPLTCGRQYTERTLGRWLESVLSEVEAMREEMTSCTAGRELVLVTNRAASLRAEVQAGNLEGVGVEAVKLLHLTRALGRAVRREELKDPAEARDLLLETLKSLKRDDLAAVLGVSTRTVASWRRGAVPTRNVPRVTALALLVSIISGSYTAEGTVLWLRTPLPELGGKTTLEALDQDTDAAWERLGPMMAGFRG